MQGELRVTVVATGLGRPEARLAAVRANIPVRELALDQSLGSALADHAVALGA